MDEKVDIGQALTALAVMHTSFGEAYMMHRYGERLDDPDDSELKQAWDEYQGEVKATQMWRRRLCRSGYPAPDDWLTAAVVGFPEAFNDADGTPCYRLKLNNPSEIMRIFREIEATVMRLENRPGDPERDERDYTELVMPPLPENSGKDDLPLGPGRFDAQPDPAQPGGAAVPGAQADAERGRRVSGRRGR